VDRQHLPARCVRNRRDIDVEAAHTLALERDHHFAGRNGRFVVVEPVTQAPVGEAQDVLQGRADQQAQGLAEELLGRRVERGDAEAWFQQNDRLRQARDQARGCWEGRVGRKAHAA